MKYFSDRLLEAISKKRSIICVGLDPQLDHIPRFLRDSRSPHDALLEFNKGIIDAVYDLVPIVKVQSAFYELFASDGVRAFEETLGYARSKGLLTIADAKRNDVGHTAQAYAQAFLGSDGFYADAVTVTPYLGWDSVWPFVEVAKKQGGGLFVLVKTSNPSSGDVQDLTMNDGSKVFEIIGRYVESWGADDLGEGGYSCVGAVVGATFSEEAAQLRKLMPHTLFLVPGYGAQGGTIEGVKACLNRDGRGAIVNASRSIIFAWEKSGHGEKDYAAAAREAVISMQEDLSSLF